MLIHFCINMCRVLLRATVQDRLSSSLASSPLLSCGHWTMDIGNWFYWTLNIGGEKSGDSSDGTSRSYKGLLWTLLNSNNFKIPNYEIYIASFFILWLIWSWKSQYLLPIPVVLPGGEGNDRPTGKFNKTMRKKKQWINTVKTKDATGVYEVPRWR